MTTYHTDEDGRTDAAIDTSERAVVATGVATGALAERLSRRDVLGAVATLGGLGASSRLAQAASEGDPTVTAEAVPEVNVRYEWNDGDERARSWGTVEFQVDPGDRTLPDALLSISAWLEGEGLKVKAVDAAVDLDTVTAPTTVTADYTIDWLKKKKLDRAKEHRDAETVPVRTQWVLLSDTWSGSGKSRTTAEIEDEDPMLYLG